jgi:hypothetical protein
MRTIQLIEKLKKIILIAKNELNDSIIPKEIIIIIEESEFTINSEEINELTLIHMIKKLKSILEINSNNLELFEENKSFELISINGKTDFDGIVENWVVQECNNNKEIDNVYIEPNIEKPIVSSIKINKKEMIKSDTINDLIITKDLSKLDIERYRKIYDIVAIAFLYKVEENIINYDYIFNLLKSNLKKELENRSHLDIERDYKYIILVKKIVKIPLEIIKIKKEIQSLKRVDLETYNKVLEETNKEILKLENTMKILYKEKDFNIKKIELIIPIKKILKKKYTFIKYINSKFFITASILIQLVTLYFIYTNTTLLSGVMELLLNN